MAHDGSLKVAERDENEYEVTLRPFMQAFLFLFSFSYHQPFRNFRSWDNNQPVLRYWSYSGFSLGDICRVISFRAIGPKRLDSSGTIVVAVAAGDLCRRQKVLHCVALTHAYIGIRKSKSDASLCILGAARCHYCKSVMLVRTDVCRSGFATRVIDTNEQMKRWMVNEQQVAQETMEF